MQVRFWGVRGSIACPGPDTVKYGGNTPCIELRFEGTDRIIIIDAGSGIRPLGNHLTQNDLPNGPIKAEIFITHTHWDHIMGFPFFDPIYLPGTQLKIYGPVTYEEDSLNKIIGDQLSYRYFPVRHSELAADIEYHQLRECSMDLGDGITLTTKYLNHSLLCLGYRFEYQGKVLCTAYDTEPFRNVFYKDPDSPDYDEFVVAEGEKAARLENEKLQSFYGGADLLIHDAQYTRKEYIAAKTGWGHSYFEYAVETARKAGVKKIALFHHDPNRTDRQLGALEDLMQERFAKMNQLKVFMAKEGMVFNL